ncbi:helix-turn-helix domain-containing protein [Undibacterium sp. Ji42W]|uniref:helix-turn-helix domain-containing protein n=1 Tax=Undibacterium sp. Ji42W TaxID=3413039 RepID=UPI003BF27E04
MKRFQIQATPQLHPYIDRLWGWESEADEVIALPELLPGTGAELYFHYRSPFQYRNGSTNTVEKLTPSHLLCMRRQTLALVAAADIGFIAVRFKIGMLPRFTDIAMRELADHAVAAEDIWGQAANILCWQLSYADTLEIKLELINTFLLGQMRQVATDVLIEQAMPLLYRRYADISIQRLADHFHIGRRQFERRFLAVSGQTASTVKCMCRFQHTLRSLMLSDAKSTAITALEHGYYDQAHFIHDFKKLTGISPDQYLKLARTKTHFYNTSQHR